MIKKSIVTLALVFTALLPIAGVFAATFGIGNDYSLRKGDAIQGDFYVLGGNPAVSGEIFGDLFIAGGNIFINEYISEDAFSIGGTVNNVAKIDGDLRIVGGNAVIAGSVSQELLVAAPDVKVTQQFFGGQDVFIAGGHVVFDGNASGTVHIIGGTVEMNGDTLGNAFISADKVIIGPNAKINGTLIYTSKQIAAIDPLSEIAGGVTYREIEGETGIKKFVPTFWGIFELIQFLILLFGALILHGIFKRISDRFIAVSQDNFVRSLLIGFAFFVALPIGLILMMLTFIGIPFVLLGFSIYLTLLIIAFFYVPVLIGSLVWKYFKKQGDVYINWKEIVVGVVLVTVLSYIPYLGFILRCLLFFVSLGAIIYVLIHKFAEVR